MILHRGHVFEDLNQHINSIYNAGLFEIVMIGTNGAKELAQDTGGVLRDALTEYWQTFFRKTTTSSRQDNLVPMLRHDFTELWPAVGRVIELGYKKTGYFPIALCKSFVMSCIGEESSEEDIVESFKSTLSEMERDTISNASFSSEEFLDFLDAYQVKTAVNTNNWPKVLYETAHKSLIQEPAYIAETWRPILTEILNADKIELLYTSLKPTVKKVLQALRFPEVMTASQHSVADYLKRFIRGSRFDRFKKFLRFCTGRQL